MPLLEHVVVQHLVQQHREVEHGESLHEGERHPDQRIRECDQSPGGEPQHRELTRRDQQVACRVLRVQRAQRLARNRVGELRPQRRRVLTVIV